MRRALALVTAVAALGAPLSLAACSDEPQKTESTSAPAEAESRNWVTVTHILIAYKGADKSKAGRSKETAKQVAESLIADVQNGRSFAELLEKFTDDRNPQTGKPNAMTEGRPGEYSWERDHPPGFAADFLKAALALPVGKITPEPVETQFGYHILRRDEPRPPEK